MRAAPRTHSPWSIQLATISRIPIRIHITFVLLLVWIALDASEAGAPVMPEVLFVLSLFGCVVLHELGHALTAQRFGIGTRDIVLYPFGGVASLMAEARPKAELYITIAGPLVNVVLAALLYPFSDPMAIVEERPVDYVTRIFVANVVLFVFNMIPAFPMDGGRILRAGLALLKIRKATLIATRISQALSLGLAVFALYTGHVLLILIASVVFVNAMQEHVRERARLAAGGLTVANVMTPASQIQFFSHGQTMGQALDIALRSMQPAFPVLHADSVVGMVDRQDLLSMAFSSAEESYLVDVINREVIAVTPSAPLEAILDKVLSAPAQTLLVIDNGNLVGMVFRDRLLEFLLVNGLRTHAKRIAEDAPI